MSVLTADPQVVQPTTPLLVQPTTPLPGPAPIAVGGAPAALGALLSAIPDLGLSRSDRQTVTIRARMLLDSLAAEPGSAEVSRHTRRLRAVLRATGNPAASALAASLSEPGPRRLAAPRGVDG